jgi:hypothetical protein
LAILQAGKLAPLAWLTVAGVLFLFRRIYAEVVGAASMEPDSAYAVTLTIASRNARVPTE